MSAFSVGAYRARAVPFTPKGTLEKLSEWWKGEEKYKKSVTGINFENGIFAPYAPSDTALVMTVRFDDGTALLGPATMFFQLEDAQKDSPIPNRLLLHPSERHFTLTDVCELDVMERIEGGSQAVTLSLSQPNRGEWTWDGTTVISEHDKSFTVTVLPSDDSNPETVRDKVKCPKITMNVHTFNRIDISMNAEITFSGDFTITPHNSFDQFPGEDDMGAYSRERRYT
jgi:hypothetical protein